eukprot:860128-Prorocentrum_minimum.AAC.1
MILFDGIWVSRCTPSSTTADLFCNRRSPISNHLGRGGGAHFFYTMGSNAWNLPISITVFTGSYDA